MLNPIKKIQAFSLHSFARDWKAYPLNKKVEAVAKLVFILAIQVFLSYSAATLGFMSAFIPKCVPLIAVGIGTLSSVILILCLKVEKKWQMIINQKLRIKNERQIKAEIDLLSDEKCKKKLGKVHALIQANKRTLLEAGNQAAALRKTVAYFLVHLDVYLNRLSAIHGDTAEIIKTKALAHRLKELMESQDPKIQAYPSLVLEAKL